MRERTQIETGLDVRGRCARCSLFARRWAGILAVVLMATFTTACREETLGDKVDDAVEDVKDVSEDVKDKAEDAADKAEDEIDKAEDKLDEKK